MNQTVPLIIRAALQALAGALATRGIAIEDNSVEAIIGGAISIATIFWSWKSKKAAVQSEQPK